MGFCIKGLRYIGTALGKSKTQQALLQVKMEIYWQSRVEARERTKKETVGKDWGASLLLPIEEKFAVAGYIIFFIY